MRVLGLLGELVAGDGLEPVGQQRLAACGELVLADARRRR